MKYEIGTSLLSPPEEEVEIHCSGWERPIGSGERWSHQRKNAKTILLGLLQGLLE